MKRKLLQVRKMLLVAAGLLVGASAWAEDTSGTFVDGSTITEIYDFNGWGLANVDSRTTATIAKASEDVVHNIDGINVYYITDPIGSNGSVKLLLNNRFAMSDPGTDRGKQQVLFYNNDSSGSRAYLGGTQVTGYISILDLPKDATITLTSEGTFTIKSENLKDANGSAIETGSELTSDATYTVTEAGNVDLYHGNWTGIKKLVIKYVSETEVVTNPTLELTGANGKNRIITVTNGVSAKGSSVKTYYTTDDVIPTSSSAEVENGNITVSSSCTIKAITISSTGGESGVVELPVEAGTTIKLANPIVKLSEMTKVEEAYNPTYTFAADATGTYGSPVITLTATFGDTSIDNASYTATAAGTIKVVAKAEGYDDSEAEVVVPGVGYVVLTSYDVADFYPGAGDGLSGNAKEYPEGLDYNMIPGLTLNPVNNTQGCTYRTTHGQGQDFYAYYGRNKGFTVTCDGLTADMMVMIENHTRADKYVLTADNNSVEISKDGSFKYYTLYAQPGSTISATIGKTGYTTFARNYALDLSNLPEGVKAYYASEANKTSVTLKEVKDKVAAGEGLILVGTANNTYDIPVATSGQAIEGNLLKGCTTETELAANANQYVLVANDEKAEFQCLDNIGATIPAGKAYLEVLAAGARLSIVIGGETTGIAEVATAGAENGAIYNLSGQRVSKPANGLYIVNGKKVIIK